MCVLIPYESVLFVYIYLSVWVCIFLFQAHGFFCFWHRCSCLYNNFCRFFPARIDDDDYHQQHFNVVYSIIPFLARVLNKIYSTTKKIFLLTLIHVHRKNPGNSSSTYSGESSIQMNEYERKTTMNTCLSTFSPLILTSLVHVLILNWTTHFSFTFHSQARL